MPPSAMEMNLDARTKIKVAILDDYQRVALKMADWSALPSHVEVTAFDDTLTDEQQVVDRFVDFDVLCVMRERTPLPASLLARLPRLRLIVTTGQRNRSIDLAAAHARGIVVANTGYIGHPTVDLTWALLLAGARNIVEEHASLRAGGWQCNVGLDLYGKTLAVLGLGRVGSKVAQIAKAFGMNVVAWSQNLTQERASEAGVTLLSKEQLFAQADFLTIHLVLGDRTRGLVSARELALMKPSAQLVNTSRGPIVVEADLIAALERKAIRCAALDVFAVEPLPSDHPFRSMPNVLATPHVGYVTEAQYRTFYGDSLRHVAAWVDGKEPDMLLQAAQ
jgi:phosphoglycerate dehydrogenase-like enzyme